MDILLRIMLISGIFFYFIILLYLIREGQLNLKYTLIWFTLGFILFVVAVFPEIVSYTGKLLGIYSEVNTIFLLLFFAVLVILMQLTAIISRYNIRVRTIAQKSALNEYRIRKQENRHGFN